MEDRADEAWRRVRKALFVAAQSGGVDGEAHKQWVIDQMVRALTGCPIENRTVRDCDGVEYTFPRQGESEEYTEWVRAFKGGRWVHGAYTVGNNEYVDGEDGPDTYDWDEGVVP